jgi:hypothetical protein
VLVFDEQFSNSRLAQVSDGVCVWERDLNLENVCESCIPVGALERRRGKLSGLAMFKG